MEENFLNLTNAVYRLLEYFPDSDPLKDRAKEKVLEIMESLVLIDGMLSNQITQNKVSEDIEMVLGYLKIGKIQGWVSSINCLIVCNEYEKIRERINKTLELASREQEPDAFEEPQEHTQTAFEPVLDKSEAEEKEALKSFVEPKNRPSKQPQEKLSERQERIIKFLEERQKAQVMDLQTVLPTVTKRTIRRDLDELLITGKIVRLGEFNQVFYRVS